MVHIEFLLPDRDAEIGDWPACPRIGELITFQGNPICYPVTSILWQQRGDEIIARLTLSYPPGFLVDPE